MQKDMEGVNNLFDGVEAKAEENAKENNKWKEKVDEVNREVNKKYCQISELLAEIRDMKEKIKEMGAHMCQCNLKMKEKEEQEEVIQQAKTILQKDEFKKSADKVHSAKDEIKTAFAEILKQQWNIKNSQKVDPRQTRHVNIFEEVKDVIRKICRSIRETGDMIVVIIGKK